MSDSYDRNPRDHWVTVASMYPVLPWQMLDLTPWELDGMIEMAKARFGA